MLAEDRRESQRKAWEILKTKSIAEAARTARDLGWKEKKVQVRIFQRAEGDEYYVEPFERDCGCPNMLKYEDFFD